MDVSEHHYTIEEQVQFEEDTKELADLQRQLKEAQEEREQVEKQVAGQKRTLHKLKGKLDKSQLRVKELEELMAGLGVGALVETCVTLATLEGE